MDGHKHAITKSMIKHLVQPIRTSLTDGHIGYLYNNNILEQSGLSAGASNAAAWQMQC